jgi:hypothetical protein
MACFSPYDDMNYIVYVAVEFLDQIRKSPLHELYREFIMKSDRVKLTQQGLILLIDIDKEMLILFSKILINRFDYEVILEVFGDLLQGCDVFGNGYTYENVIYPTDKPRWKNVLLADKLFNKLNQYKIDNNFVFYKANKYFDVNFELSHKHILHKIHTNNNKSNIKNINHSVVKFQMRHNDEDDLICNVYKIQYNTHLNKTGVRIMEFNTKTDQLKYYYYEYCNVMILHDNWNTFIY